MGRRCTANPTPATSWKESKHLRSLRHSIGKSTLSDEREKFTSSRRMCIGRNPLNAWRGRLDRYALTRGWRSAGESSRRARRPYYSPTLLKSHVSRAKQFASLTQGHRVQPCRNQRKCFASSTPRPLLSAVLRACKCRHPNPDACESCALILYHSLSRARCRACGMEATTTHKDVRQARGIGFGEVKTSNIYIRPGHDVDVARASRRRSRS